MTIDNELRSSAQAEKGLTLINGVLVAVSRVNRAIVRAIDESSLLNEVCTLLVQYGRYLCARIYCKDGDERGVMRCLAEARREDAAGMSCEDIWIAGGDVVCAGKPVINRSPAAHPIFGSCEADGNPGCYSSIALQLSSGGEAFGAMVLHAGEPERFDDEEKSLLGELADDLAFGINDRRERENDRRQMLVQSQEAVSEVRAARQMLSSAFERVTDAFVALDRNWRYTYVNARAGELFGRRPEELLGKHIWTEFPDGVGQPFQLAYEKAMASQQPVHLEDYYAPWNRWFENVIYPSPDGLSIYFHDITDRKRSDFELSKRNRELGALSECNKALVRSTDEIQLLSEICNVMVKAGGFKMAWIGYRVDDEAKTVQPVVQAGYEEGYLDTLHITWDDTRQGSGPTGAAIRTGHPVISRDILTDPQFEPWRDEALKRGYASSIALPLVEGGETFGALCVYSDEPGAFDPEEVALLTELASDLSFGIIAHRTRAEREKVERERQAAYKLLESIIEFIPDAIIVIDREKRIIAWNRACEIMTGVMKEEMLGQGDYAYALPFFGVRSPILIDRLDKSLDDIRHMYKYVERNCDKLFAEAFVPGFRGGPGTHFWVTAGPLFDQDGIRCGAIESVRDVTEQRRVEEAMRESELKYRKLFETAGDAILLMHYDRFIDCNNKALEMYGCLREQIIGAHPSQFSPLLQPDGRASDEKAGEMIRLAYEKGTMSFEWQHCRYDGTVFWADVTLNSLELNGEKTLQAIVRDVSERRMVMYELQRRTNEMVRLNALGRQITTSLSLEEVLQTIVTESCQAFGSDLAVVFLQKGDRLELFRTGPDESRLNTDSRSVRTVCEHLCRRAFNKNQALYFDDLGPERSLCYGGCDMAGIISFAALPLSGTKGCMGVLGLASAERRDFAGRATFSETLTVSFGIAIQNAILHEQLQQYAEDLEQRVLVRTSELASAKERAESADRIKSAFLASMSHELRTPLNSIIGFTGIVLQGLAGPLNDEQHKQLDMVYGSARHLLALINDILDLSKIESGQLKTEASRFDARRSVEKVIRSLIPLAEKKSLTLAAELSPDVGEIVSDCRRFEQILINLISNGLKFTEKGGVRVICSIDGNELVTRVVDTGIGIKPENMGELFQTFRQLDSGLTRSHEGTGLGLSICRRLVEIMGGRIWAESGWGVGSVFAFTLPLTK